MCEHHVALTALNSLGVCARAHSLYRITSAAQVRQILSIEQFVHAQPLILGGGSNIVLARDVATVLKVEVTGMALVDETPTHWVVQAGAGVLWQDMVLYCHAQGWFGLENMALIPGTVGAAPVQNIGAYGMELQDVFHSLDAVDLVTGRSVTLDARACAFGYRHSVFKGYLAGKSLITHVRLAIAKRWQPPLGYADIHPYLQAAGLSEQGPNRPTAAQLLAWISAIRKRKLPDPTALGNAGSFFKNPCVDRAQLRALLERDAQLVHHALDDGRYKLAAGWLIDACGWRGKRLGQAGVYDQQALVLVNHGGASGANILALARAIQNSVQQRFGVHLEIEPAVVGQ